MSAGVDQGQTGYALAASSSTYTDLLPPSNTGIDPRDHPSPKLPVGSHMHDRGFTGQYLPYFLGFKPAWGGTSGNPVINAHLDHVDAQLLTAIQNAIGSVYDMLATCPTDTHILHSYAAALHAIAAQIDHNKHTRMH